jgi:hypothetical protein
MTVRRERSEDSEGEPAAATCRGGAPRMKSLTSDLVSGAHNAKVSATRTTQHTTQRTACHIAHHTI